jgi:hypothetical protein
MTATTWSIEDNDGRLLSDFASTSRLELELKVAPTRYDAFRLQVSASYRELFERAVRQVLEREGWHIVQIKPPRPFPRRYRRAGMPA